MVMLDISEEGLNYMYRRAAQGAVNRHYGIPVDEESLSTEEVAELVHVLNSTQDQRCKREILEIIRYEGSYDPLAHMHIIEPFLDDLSYTFDALFTLCIDWGLTSHYVDELREFIRGKEVPWPHGNQQSFAVGIAKDYLYHHKEPTLLREIIELYERAPHNRDDGGSAEYALRALFGRDTDPDNSDLFLQRAREELALQETDDLNKQQRQGVENGKV